MTPDWIAADGPSVATTLPVTTEPVRRPGDALPVYFAGLLPEGRRLGALRRAVKRPPTGVPAEVDFSDVVLVGVKHNKATAVDISLTGDGELKGISAVIMVLAEAFYEAAIDQQTDS